ncbi:MAG: hypothetical protein ACLT8E_07185 [Akkermansia sp.]
MKKLRITVDGKVFDVSVELLDQVSSTTSAPAPAPLRPGSRTRSPPLSRRPLRSHARPRPGRRRCRRRAQPARRQSRFPGRCPRHRREGR